MLCRSKLPLATESKPIADGSLLLQKKMAGRTLPSLMFRSQHAGRVCYGIYITAATCSSALSCMRRSASVVSAAMVIVALQRPS